MSKPNKEKRIDKEIYSLRNLPRDFKLGMKETQLGTFVDVRPLLCSLLSRSKSTNLLSIQSIWIRASSDSISTFC